MKRAVGGGIEESGEGRVESGEVGRVDGGKAA